MRKSFLMVSMLLSTLMVFADDNVLQTIQIDPVRDTYNIVLISDKAVDVKKDIEEDGSILLSMKGIRASEMLNTVYNSAADIDSVIVTPKKDNELDIRVKGNNVERSTVTFDSLTPPVKAITKKKANKEIVLNKPMKTYEPVFTEDEDEFSSVSIAPLGQKIVNTIKSIYENRTNRNIINFGLLGIILFSAIRLIRSREKEEIKVGLSQSLANREINLYKPLQTPVVNNYTSTGQKPYTTLNYGLNAYRNVNRNPYETSPQSKAAKNIAVPAARNTEHKTVERVTATAEMPRNIAKNTTTQTNIDNVKFLETMTAIYEKSGRHDLAQGIKANLSKVSS